jgi:hypothetical protein
MPANLNALIRYKTINCCLRGGRRKWSIGELIDACSEALADSRERYNAVSERTLRDDLRIMRSDIMGFNAPIKQEKGLYFYSDPDYSILSISISDSGLLTDIIKLLQEIKAEVSNPELDSILEKLLNMPGYADVRTESRSRMRVSEKTTRYYDAVPEAAEISEIGDELKKPEIVFSSAPIETVTWGAVLEII